MAGPFGRTAASGDAIHAVSVFVLNEDATCLLKRPRDFAFRLERLRASPFRTVPGFQASHVDVELYDRFYRPEALSETERARMQRWHGAQDV